MSFWNLSDNNQLSTSGEFEIAKAMEPIPAKTQARAIIDEAKWDEYKGDNYISLSWSIIYGEYKNRKVFQKLKVKESDDKKRDKALSMLAAIDANAGGRLVASGKEPTDMELALCLCNKPMIIRIEVWEIDDKKGNWISAVAPVVKRSSTPAPQGAKPADDDFFV